MAPLGRSGGQAEKAEAGHLTLRHLNCGPVRAAERVMTISSRTGPPQWLGRRPQGVGRLG